LFKKQRVDRSHAFGDGVGRFRLLHEEMIGQAIPESAIPMDAPISTYSMLLAGMSGNLLGQRAHLAHVLLAGHGVDHAAGTKEQQRLEESVRHQWKMPAQNAPTPQRQEHVSQLADRRIRQHALDIVLHQAHGRRENRRERADRRPRHRIAAPVGTARSMRATM
jgi:hypothetical protein